MFLLPPVQNGLAVHDQVLAQQVVPKCFSVHGCKLSTMPGSSESGASFDEGGHVACPVCDLCLFCVRMLRFHHLAGILGF